MSISSIKSTIRIDPVRQAISRANRLLEDGDYEQALATLEPMAEQHPNRQDLKDALQQARQAGQVEVVTHGSSNWAWWLILAVIVAVAGYLLFF